MNLLTTFALYFLKEFVNNVKLCSRSAGERRVFKKRREKGILGSVRHQTSIHFVHCEFQNYFTAQS